MAFAVLATQGLDRLSPTRYVSIRSAGVGSQPQYDTHSAGYGGRRMNVLTALRAYAKIRCT